MSGNLGAVQDLHAFLLGGGEMAREIRSIDWSKTPLGPLETWPQNLKTTTRFVLSQRFPMLLWWGPEYIQIYNDAYRPIPGAKHPHSLGQPARECWPEIWHILQPLIDTPFYGGPATWMEDIGLEITRHGFMEETHFTIAYSPVPDETAPRGIGGVLATVHEITEKVVAERRVEILRDLGARAPESKSAEEACLLAGEVLAKHAIDVPFALFYLLEEGGAQARLAASAGVAMGAEAGPLVVELDAVAGHEPSWPLALAVNAESLTVVDDLASRFAQVPPGPWADPPSRAVIVPIRSNIAHKLAGVLVAGVSSRLKLDERYKSFFELVTTQIATSIANARAYEEERKRAEALAELDRAKTVFFSNVSHEFRTPLTLLLGPLEDVLAKPEAEVPAEIRSLVDVAHRNGLRLLKLVNTLLDFSRIEAGRALATYEPVDLAAYTAELASVFRSAIERAGLRLVIDCPPLPEPVYVDRDMWEKIVLNLVSNAFKFTFKGEITVSLRAVDGAAALTVRDTGIGIRESEIIHVFERFHRVNGTQARTHEGTGIGLALVQELVKLHGGAVRVESVYGEGSAFTASIPFGSAHLPSGRVGASRMMTSTAIHGPAFVQEALHWLPEGVQPSLSAASGTARPDRILLADDNADMREYVRRLLAGKYEIEAVPDGHAALTSALATPPALVLTDVMMPGIDGVELLKRLRAHESTRAVPVILLSARAGEESKVEGLEAGADDYLVKPFTARELLARVAAHLEMARVRKEAEERLREAEKLECIRLLAGGIAHDFNNLLTGVIGNASLARDQLQAHPAGRLMDSVLKAGEHAAHLTRQLLAYSGKGGFQAQKLDLSAAAADTAGFLKASLSSRIHLDLRLSPDLPSLHADPAQLRQVIVSLVTNAAEAIGQDGAGVISVRTASRDLNDDFIRRKLPGWPVSPGKFVTLVVEDTGEGMDQKTAARIFEPFFTTRFMGRGLGLAAVAGIVRSERGAIQVESEVGKGTAFTVFLPAQPVAQMTSRRATVLVAEDEDYIRKFMQAALEGQGFSVLLAEDGQHAISLFRENRDSIDLVILDLKMPGTPGDEALRAIKSIRPAVKVLIASGLAEDEAYRLFAGTGVSGFLSKPFTASTLNEKVKAVLSGSQSPAPR